MAMAQSPFPDSFPGRRYFLRCSFLLRWPWLYFSGKSGNSAELRVRQWHTRDQLTSKYSNSIEVRSDQCFLKASACDSLSRILGGVLTHDHQKNVRCEPVIHRFLLLRNILRPASNESIQ